MMIKLFSCIFILLQFKNASTFASEQSIAEPLVKWQKSELQVCFSPNLDGKAFTLEEQEVIKSALVREYTAEKTGAYFMGFKLCKKGNHLSADVTVMPFENLKNGTPQNKYLGLTSGIGQDGHAEMSMQWNFIKGTFTQKIGIYERGKNKVVVRMVSGRPFEGGMQPLQVLELTALHEFGHVLGLRHEHARREAPYDLNCKVMETELSEEEYSTTVHFGNYDPNSIMNYCWMQFMMQSGGVIYYNPLPHVAVTLPTPFQGMVMRFLPNFNDAKIITVTENAFQDLPKIEFKITLSAGDRKTLKTMYSPEAKIN